MSADTTVVVLGAPTGEQDREGHPVREYRVRVLQAAENITMPVVEPWEQEFRDQYLVCNFRNCRPHKEDEDLSQVTRSMDQALTWAAEMYHRWHVREWILEYGVALVELDEPLPS